MASDIVDKKDEAISKKFYEKYTERQGKQLYVRYPTKLPTDENEFQQKAKALSKLVTSVHRPRQKHARFCLLSFESKQDRDAALEDIRSKINAGVENFKGVHVSIPRTENEEFLQKLLEKKLKSVETKRSKWEIKRLKKKAKHSQNATSSIILQNLPQTCSLSEIKDLFPSAVDINIKQGMGKNRDYSLATITLPSTAEAKQAAKKKISIGDKRINVRLGLIKQKNALKNRRVLVEKEICK